MADAQGWRERLETLGHTGWRNPVTYTYDQLERLALIEHELDALELEAGAVAVDFGCGTGDFSQRLLDRGCEVFGCDPFVAPTLEHPRFHHFGDLADLAAQVTGARLALSVTVLDHIVDEARFAETLRTLRGCLTPGATLLLLEYALDDDFEAPRGMQPSEFQAFRRLAAWRKALPEAGFELESVAPIPHPGESPSRGYRAYRKSLGLRVLRLLKLSRTGFGERQLRRLALRAQRRHAVGPHSDPSPMKRLRARAIS